MGRGEKMDNGVRMPLTTAAEFKIERLGILDSEGRRDASIPLDISEETLLRMHRLMSELRVYDEKAFKLQRQGRLGTYPPISGQEATQVVPPLCLTPKDWLIPTYRGQGAYFARGQKLRYNLLYWAGDDKGVNFPEENNDLIFSVPVGAHLTHAAGLAWGAKLAKDGRVALCYLGDGASSKGDFHEALTFAGVMTLPVIYLIENNQYAISLPRARQCAAKTLAQKAVGYGVFGLQVDGNDPLAVYKAVSDAVSRARAGGGATVLECETYRIGHHTTADDAARYRSGTEVEGWKARDPLERLRRHLFSLGLLDEARVAAVVREAESMVREEVRLYESFPPPNPLDMFAHNYDSAPWPLVEQRAELESLLKDKLRRKEEEELPPAEGRFP